MHCGRIINKTYFKGTCFMKWWCATEPDINIMHVIGILFLLKDIRMHQKVIIFLMKQAKCKHRLFSTFNQLHFWRV